MALVLNGAVLWNSWRCVSFGWLEFLLEDDLNSIWRTLNFQTIGLCRIIEFPCRIIEESCSFVILHYYLENRVDLIIELSSFIVFLISSGLQISFLNSFMHGMKFIRWELFSLLLLLVLVIVVANCCSSIYGLWRIIWMSFQIYFLCLSESPVILPLFEWVSSYNSSIWMSLQLYFLCWASL